MTDHCFISYSTADALEFARKLANKLEGGNIPVWFDKDDLKPGADWDTQIDAALKACRMVLFVMTADSVHDKSVCKQEWSRALSYKKPIVPLWVHNDIVIPMRLADRQRIDFRKGFDAGLANLREHLAWLDSPAGVLSTLADRLLDAERDIQRASPADQPRIQADIEDLKKQIEVQQKIVDDPEAAEAQTQANIAAGLERERKPEKPVISNQSTKFINPPPGVAQSYFQDRTMETEQVILFLKNDAQRLMTVAGRGGAGKTAMVCRLLKHIENSSLPDDFETKHGKIGVDGIVYLSETGTRKVNFANLFADLCRLLPADVSARLDELYRNPQTSPDEKTHKLLEAFSAAGRVIVLLDNFENVVDAEARDIADAELDEALKAVLHAPHHPLKFIITTRVTPHQFDLYEPARQRPLPLDTGLAPEFAKEAFLLMDEGGLVGLKDADKSLLNLAVERTRGLPRALEALYAALRSDRYTTLAELLALPVLPENVVAAYVGEAFNRLDTNAQKVMQALAVYNRPVPPAAVDYLLAPHLPTMDSAPILQRLANMHFARKESGKYYLHPVDREFAFSLLPEGNINDKLRAGNGLALFQYFMETVNKYPDLLQNQETLKQAAQEAPPDFLRDVLTSIFSLDLSTREKMQDSKNFQDKEYLAVLDKSIKVPQAWTRYALTNRAADYFAQARKPRAEWKKLDDLSAQLAEFDLRCAAGDYDTAASVLNEIGFDYLLLWGHYRLMIELNEKLQGKISDNLLAMNSVGNLGTVYREIGKVSEALQCYEQAVTFAKQGSERQTEGQWLMGVGSCYAFLGNINKAIEYQEQALIIAREVNDKDGQGIVLGNLGNRYAALGETDKAIQLYEEGLTIERETGYQRGESSFLDNISRAFIILGDYQKAMEYSLKSIQVADEIPFLYVQHYAREGLAQVYLLQNDLFNARATIEAALGYDVPENNHNVSALRGIIALQQGDEVTARGAFVRAIEQADEILSKTAEYYSALDAKGLASCGLALTVGAEQCSAPTNNAIEIFRKARKIAPHAGVVKSVLRLFDELAKCDKDGVLKDVRKAVEGVE